MTTECCLKSSRLVKKSMKNETKCMTCKSTIFKVNRITPELVMLTCENCGAPHMIGVNLNENRINLLFWSPETDDAQ